MVSKLLCCTHAQWQELSHASGWKGHSGTSSQERSLSWTPGKSSSKPNLRLGPSLTHQTFGAMRERSHYSDRIHPHTDQAQLPYRPILNNSIYPDWQSTQSCCGINAWHLNPTDSSEIIVQKTASLVPLPFWLAVQFTRSHNHSQPQHVLLWHIKLTTRSPWNSESKEQREIEKIPYRGTVYSFCSDHS
jgi:hypothetical protein